MKSSSESSSGPVDQPQTLWTPQTPLTPQTPQTPRTPQTPLTPLTPLTPQTPSAPPLSLQSPELQAEFLKECHSRFQFHSDFRVPADSPPSPLRPSPPSPLRPSPPSSSSPSPNSSRALGLSSPELLGELKESSRRSLRPVPPRRAQTTVFSGRGGQVSGSAPPS
ncbi:uncharacterized protein ACNS7B_003105 [Menidia menidia]